MTPAPPWGWLLAALCLSGCTQEGLGAYDFGLPEGFPVPQVPADNPMSEVKIELGRRLFYDTRLSLNETQSCASCHRQELAFTDGLAQSLGSTGQRHPRSSMSLANAGYVPRLTWANPLLDSLEEQVLVPIFGEEPVELGMAGQETELLQRLQRDADYAVLFADAFPGAPSPISVANLARALGAFQRTLISSDSPYDRLVYQDEVDALSDSARRGGDLFFGERLECFHCHGGFNLSDSQRHNGTVSDEVAFHNTALYNIDGFGSYPEDNQGIRDVTLDPRDMGRFRAPSLRNIEVTAPYFHDGSAATLDDVLDHYAAGGRRIVSGPNAGDGSASPIKSVFLQGFTLNEQERADVLAFLRSLTDATFLTDPRFADPFAEDARP